MKTTPRHEQIYKDLVNILRKHEVNVTQIEILAIAANMVGKLIALQDQRIVSSEYAMRVVLDNIEIGNAQVINSLNKTQGKA